VTGLVASGSADAATLDVDDTIIRLVEPVVRVREPGESLASAAFTDITTSTTTATPISRWALRVRGTSHTVSLDLPAIVGRRPGLARVAEQPVPRRVVIPQDFGDVSARHVRIEQLGETLVVADLGSTNGTVVHWSSGSRLRLRSGESCAVLPDAVIVLGDGVEIEFVAADAPTAVLTPFTPRRSEPS